MKQFLYSLVKPRSQNKDKARQEFILNILLVSWILLSLIAILGVTINYVKNQSDFDGGPPQMVIAVFLILTLFYLLSRRGHARWAAYLFIIALTLVTINLSLTWGTILPRALVTYALIIVMAGVLISSRVSLIFTVLIGVILTLLTHFQDQGTLTYDNLWRFQDNQAVGTVTVIAVTLGIIAIVSWLSNREIEKSLQRARNSEADLKIERDTLELKVEQRTRELHRAHIERLSQVYRLAEFGRSAGGYFHELANPLTALSLNLERLSTNDLTGSKTTLEEIRARVDRALKNAKRMETFVKSARKNLSRQDQVIEFTLGNEINEAIEVLKYRARKNSVKIRFAQVDDFSIRANPLKFNQIITNLLSNAIDAYSAGEEDTEAKEHEVLISTKREGQAVMIQVTDWGIGIEKDNLPKIYDPLFTTKSADKGTGLGLQITKKLVETEFKGTISVISKPGAGTTFTIRIPVLDIQK